MERQATNPDTVICPSCIAENHVFQSFCKTCDTPIGAMTNLDPVNIIRAQGDMLQKALEGRPKFIVVLGIWILHLPVLLLGVATVIYTLINVKDSFDLIVIAIFTGLSYFAFIVLYRITRNYVTSDEHGRGSHARKPGPGSLQTA